MKLSPLDIKRQQFAKSFRGYEPDEVDAFLKQIASQWESALDEIRLATERNRELEQKLKHYERVELALQEALETARETARRSEEAAERKAKIIVEQAEMQAQRTLQDAEQERFGLRRDLAKLTGRQNEVAARLRAFLMSELEILAQFQGDDPVGFIRLESATVPQTERLEAHIPESLPPADLEDDADADGISELPDDAAESSALDEPVSAESREGVASDPDPSPVAETPEPLSPSAVESADPTEEAPPSEPSPLSTATPAAASVMDWEMPETVEPAPQPETSGGWNLRTVVTGESESVAGSEAERERIRRILEDLD